MLSCSLEFKILHEHIWNQSTTQDPAKDALLSPTFLCSLVCALLRDDPDRGRQRTCGRGSFKARWSRRFRLELTADDFALCRRSQFSGADRMDVYMSMKGGLTDRVGAAGSALSSVAADVGSVSPDRSILISFHGVLTSDLPPPGNLSKTCTADGWTEMHPLDIALNCGYNLNGTSEDVSRLQLIRAGGAAA